MLRHRHSPFLVRFILPAVMLGAVVMTTGVPAQPEPERERVNDDASDSSSKAESPVKRGRYIVHHLAMCVQCHSPRSSAGELVEEELLQGGRIMVRRPFPNQKWALTAPKLAGLPGGWSEKQMVTFLQTGRTPAGRFAEPPMPPFRMNAEDARAVTAYLQSVDRD